MRQRLESFAIFPDGERWATVPDDGTCMREASRFFQNELAHRGEIVQRARVVKNPVCSGIRASGKDPCGLIAEVQESVLCSPLGRPRSASARTIGVMK